MTAWFAGIGIGCVFGAFAAWLLARRARDSQGAALEARLDERDAQLAAAAVRDARHAEEVRELTDRCARAEASGEASARAAEEKLRLVAETGETLTRSFQALSAQALRANNEQFLQQARLSMEKFQESARGDLDSRQKSIAEIVRPVQQSLEKFEGQVQEMEKQRVGAYAGLWQQMNHLKDTTGRLATALRSPSPRGRWAEIHLRRAVELAGLLDRCDFEEQVTVRAEGTAVRPDMVVHLPAGRTVLVDAKAPLEAYLAAAEASDEATRTARLRDHAAQVRQHVTQLARKSYWERFGESAELIVLYLPNDALFTAALEHDRDLLDQALAQRVVIATPSTLAALLLTVAHGWKQEKIAANAREIANLGRDLHKRMADAGKHLARLGRSIDGTVRAYNDAVGSLESRVLPAARRFRELQAAAIDVEIEPLEPVELQPRPVVAAELAERELPEDAN
jgi:DNA recombination protein RmuC